MSDAPDGPDPQPKRNEGDPVALDALLTRHLPALRAFLRLDCGGVVRDRDSASDLVQSVCREVLAESQFEYRGEAEFRRWLFTVARHKVVDRARYHRAQARDPEREVRLASDAQDSLSEVYAHLVTPSQVAMAREGIEQIELCFDRLPEDYRRAITLSRLVGLSYRDIAQEMDRTESSIRNLLPRALRRLAGELGLAGLTGGDEEPS